MDFELSSEQRSYQQLVRKLLEAEAPLEKIRDLPEDGTLIAADYWRKAADLGWVSMLVPDELGGGSIDGSPLRELTIVAREIGRGVAPGPLIPCNVVAWALGAVGTKQQQEEILPRLMSGEAIASWAIADINGTWDAGAITVTGEDKGAAVLNGEAHYVESGSDAAYFLVTAKAVNGVSQYIVEADTQGVEVTATAGPDHARTFASVRFTDVTVSADSRVGEAGVARETVDRQLAIAIALQSAESMGAWQHFHEMSVEYAADRTAFGRPIGSFQAIKHLFANQKMWMEAGHGMTERLTQLLEENEDDVASLVSGTKALVGDRALEAVQDAIQVHGGIGVTMEHDLHLYLRRLTLNKEIYGSPRDHRDRLCTLAGLGNRED